MLNRSLRAFCTLLFILGIYGCSTQASITNKSKPLVHAPNGLVLASLGYVKDSDPSAKMFLTTSTIVVNIRPADSNNSAAVKSMHVGGSLDWDQAEIVQETSNRIRILRAVELEPGNYALFSYQLAVGFSTYTFSQDMKYDPPILFTVRPGEITYVGSHEMKMTTGKNMLGLSVPSRASFVVSNRFQEDLDQLRRVRPELANVQATSALER